MGGNNPNDVLKITGTTAASVITFSFTNTGTTSIDTKITGQANTADPSPNTVTVSPATPTGSTSGPGDADGQSDYHVDVTSSPGHNEISSASYTVSCTNPATPDLTIDKSHTGDATQGQVGFHYSLAVSNVGTASTSGTVTVSDTLPAGMTPTAASGTGWSCSISSQTVTCTRSDALAVSSSYPTITVTVNVAANAPPTVVNVGTVSGGGETNTANDSSSDPTNVTQLTPDLTITKSHTGDATQGQSGFTYTLKVQNVGTAATSGTVTVSDTLPAGMTPTAASGTGWTCGAPVGQTVSCSRSDALAVGAFYPDITVTNTATVSGGGETNTANDSSSDPTNVTQLAPDLTIAKSHSGNPQQGQVGFTYTLTVKNVGLNPTSGTVSVVDTLPAGMTATAISGTGWSCTLATLTCTRSDALAAGASYPDITVTVNVAANAPASVINTATVSGGGETNTANDTATDPTTITQLSPDLKITKSHSGTAQQGQIGFTYTLKVENVGLSPTSGTVSVVDTPPAGMTVTAISGTNWSCVLATLTCTRSDPLAAGASYEDITVTVNIAVNAPPTLTNVSTVSGGGDTTPGNNTSADTVSVAQAHGALTLTKTPSPSTFNSIGQVITYTFVVTNTGQATVTSLTVADPKTSVSCPANFLASGASMTCTSSYTITAADMSAGSVTIVAEANGNDPNGPVPTAKATATVKRNDDFIRDRTTQVIQNFLYRRADQLLSNEPDRNRLIRRLPGSLWGSRNGQSSQGGSTFTVSGGDGGPTHIAFATSFSQMMADARAARQKKLEDQVMGLGAGDHASVKDAPLPVWNSGFDVWVEGHYSHFDDDQGKGDRSGHLGVMYVGTDYLVTPGLLIGALVELDWMDDTSNSLQTKVDGHGWMAGPYMSARLTDNLFFDARAAWGTSDNTVNPLGFFVDSFETDRWLVRANLTGNWNYGNWRFTPSASVARIEENQHAYVDALGISIPGQSVALGRVTFGPEVAYRYIASDGIAIEPMASIQGLWDFEKPDTLTIGDQIVSPDTFRGKVEAGVMFSMPAGATVRATGNYDGIGSSDFHAYGGQLWVNLPLH